jgi:hypothetical protein
MNDDHGFPAEVQTVAQKLLAYCHKNDWAGYDPYDALNSRLLEALPVLNSRLPRLVLTQVLKRSPINVRDLLQIPRTQNPKAVALFLAALLRAPELVSCGSEKLVDSLTARLLALKSPGNWCWGYSFPWQTRTIIVPRGAPNLVCTSFVTSALLDLYEQRRDLRHLAMAVGGGDYILNELYWSDGKALAGFSYPLPSVRNQIHNANLLAAALFCRLFKHTGETRFLEPALRVARYSAAKQHADGSWYYGEAPSQQWIDNFHTGYNLCALRQIDQYLDSDEFAPPVLKGFAFYKNHFFREDGAVRYFHNRTYPIDIHCVAQSIITLLALGNVETGNVALARSVFRWAMKHMWNDEGFFAYRVLRVGTIWTSYMRWSQAWMLLAMASLLSELNATVHPTQSHSVPASVEVRAC